MEWRNILRKAWMAAVVAMFLMAVFWSLWYLFAGQLPAIPDTLLYDPPSSKATIAVPAWLLHSHWWDIPGIGLAAMLLFVGFGGLFRLTNALDGLPDNDGPHILLFVGHLVVLCGTFIGQLVNAIGRDWTGMAAHAPLTALALSTLIVIGYGFYAYWRPSHRGLLCLHLACLFLQGPLLGLAVGLSGLGLVWPPLVGLGAGLAGVLAALLATLAVGTAAFLIWLVIRLGFLVASPRAEFERLRWRWWLFTGFDVDGVPPDGDWEAMLPVENFRAVTGRDDWREQVDRAEALCALGAEVLIQQTYAKEYAGRTAVVLGKKRDGFGWVKVRLVRPVPGRPRQTYFRIGLSYKEDYHCDLELLRQADGTPVNYDPLYPGGVKPAWLCDKAD